MLQESMPRLQKYFSRKTSDQARDALLDKVKHHDSWSTRATWPPLNLAHRAFDRLRNMSKSSYMGLDLDSVQWTLFHANLPFTTDYEPCCKRQCRAYRNTSAARSATGRATLSLTR